MNALRNTRFTVPNPFCSDCGQPMPLGYQDALQWERAAAPLCPMCLGAALQQHLFASGCCD